MYSLRKQLPLYALNEFIYFCLDEARGKLNLSIKNNNHFWRITQKNQHHGRRRNNYSLYILSTAPIQCKQAFNKPFHR